MDKSIPIEVSLLKLSPHNQKLQNGIDFINKMCLPFGDAIQELFVFLILIQPQFAIIDCETLTP